MSSYKKVLGFDVSIYKTSTVYKFYSLQLKYKITTPIKNTIVTWKHKAQRCPKLTQTQPRPTDRGTVKYIPIFTYLLAWVLYSFKNTREQEGEM